MLGLGYEILALGVGMAVKLWQKLASRWIDRLADAIDLNLRIFIARYRRAYYRWIFFRYRDVDVKGLSTQGAYNLELDQVFVDLAIEPRPAHAASSDPIRSLTRPVGRKRIWNFLEEARLGQHFVLIGPPGSGKTTLLQKMALQLTGRRGARLRQTIPILLFLREHNEAIRDIPTHSLAEAIKASLARKQGPTAPAGWFESHLHAGRCLILLDGLDEVAATESRTKVVSWVEAQMSAYPRNRFLITSRPHGYRANPLSGVTVLEVQPFSWNQIDKFVHNWYRANEIRASGKLDPGVEMKAREGANDLLRRLGNSILMDLAVNPLLLTMISTVHRFRSTLPGRRVELYAEICEVFLGKRQQARGLESDLTPAQKQRVLQSLAYELMLQKRREISVDEAVRIIGRPLKRVAGRRAGAEETFLKEIEEGSGVLLERERRVLSFAHLAFQEYLAATHAREERLGADLVLRVADPWWHEVLRLYGAQDDASSIIEACLANVPFTVSVLSLAIDCLEESREVDPQIWERVEFHIRKGVEDIDHDRFILAATTMLTRRLRNMETIAENTLADASYVTHSEFQIFVEQRANRPCHLDHWHGSHFPKGKGLSAVAGIRWSDAESFCDWLSLREDTWRFRLPRAGELDDRNLRTSKEEAAGYWLADVGQFQHVVPMRQRISVEYAQNLLERDLAIEAWPTTIDRSVILQLDIARQLANSLRILFALDVFNVIEVIGELDRSLNRFFSLGQELNLDHALDFAESRNRDLDHSRAKALTLARTLNTRHSRSQGLGSAALSSRPLHGTDSLFFQFIHLEHDDSEPLVSKGQRLAVSLDRAGILDHARTRDVALTLALRRSLPRDSPPQEVARIYRWAGRIVALFTAIFIDSEPPDQGQRFPWNLLRQGEAFDKGLAKEWLLVYRDLVVLEARIDGQSPAIEGLRLIKERPL